MGGKFWSPEEQEYFIHEVMSKSRFNGKDGAYNPNKGMSWTELADMMQHDMDERKLARRQYTGNMLYEHWYQTVKKDWGEDRVRILAASAKAARHGADRQPRSNRVKKAKKRVDTMSPLPVAAKQSNQRTISPKEQRKEVVSRRNSTESSDSTSNHSLMTCYPAPESYSTLIEGSSMAHRRFPDPPINSGSSTNRHFHPYRAPDAYRQSHTRDPATYHHQRYPEHPEAQTPLQTRDPEIHMRITSTTPSKAPHQPLNLQQRLPIMIRDPTPDGDENSLFVEQDYSEYNRRTSVPRPNTELDAAVTMTMFHRQEMHTLHGTPARRFDHLDGRRTFQQVRPDAHAYQRYIGDTTPEVRLAASIPRADTVRRSQKQGRSGQLEKSNEDDENDGNGNE
ncbi:uncharacterized protein EAE97_005694 [Botrytis byssoidea]|uniref:Uncharacterized protein n=1 Tax=Botrytis byssoidea TaxID=139641 RepID=A0A9P5IM17_9HELO|nr:uncharacterized protein EAE97_005694 [Botrytis byssoidea]KAF7943623.1 hypothetical protein EAE97_005694 [Botrytis byssoidea]